MNLAKTHHFYYDVSTPVLFSALQEKEMKAALESLTTMVHQMAAVPAS
jgi:hypothetical protein